MPLLYEMVYQRPKRQRYTRLFQEITEKSYNLLDPAIASPPFPKDLSFGPFGSGTLKANAFVKVTWNPKKTVLNQAILTWTAHKWAGFLGDRLIDLRFSVNDVLVSARGWGFGEMCVTKGNPEGLNIGAHLKNGTNKFSIEVVGAGAAGSGGIDFINAFFVAQFKGEEPTVEPPPPAYLTYLKWGLVGVGTVAFVAVVVPKLLERRRGKG